MVSYVFISRCHVDENYSCYFLDKINTAFMGCVLSCSSMFTRCIYSELTVVTIKLRKVNKKPQAKNTSLEVILLLIIVIFFQFRSFAICICSRCLY